MVIIRTMLKTLCKQAGYSDRRFLEWAKAQGLVLCDSRGTPTKQKRFGGAARNAYFSGFPMTSEENYDDGVPF